MDIQIKKLESKDIETFVELIHLFEDVFEMQNFVAPEKPYLQKMLKKDSFFVFVAFLDENLVGGLTAYTLEQYYSTKPLVYIYDLAVKSEFQRQGFGKRLIESITEYCEEAGVEEVFVQADEEDDYALDFYCATGGLPEKVVHFSYPLN